MLLVVSFAWGYCFKDFYSSKMHFPPFYGGMSHGLHLTEIVGQALYLVSVFSGCCHWLCKQALHVFLPSLAKQTPE